MALLRAASRARCSELVTTCRSVPYLASIRRWYERSARHLCSQSSKRTTPDIPALYKALTRPFPSSAPDPKLTFLLQAARNSNDPHAAVNALTSHVTTNSIHDFHVTTAVQLCLPAKPELAESLLCTLTQSLPSQTLTPGRALLARYYTSRNDPQTALATINFPMHILSEPPANLCAHAHSLHLGSKPAVWGVVIKSLTQLNYPSHACATAEEAMRRHVPLTDTLLHLCIDALRADNRWQHANSLFEMARAQGLSPSERTVGSLLIALTCRHARAQVDRNRVIEVVDMVQSPSVKFLNVALMALTSVGAILRAERVFVELTSDGKAEEHMLAKMLAGLGNFLELLPAEDVDTIDASTYSGISERGDELWGEYLRMFPRGKQVSDVLSKLLRAKTRCFRQKEAVDVLEGLVEYDRGDISDLTHIVSVMGAVELACDVPEMKRLLKIMDKLGLTHDMRSLAFCLGTLIGDGNLTEAVNMVRQKANEAIEGNGKTFKVYHTTLLLRRLRTLVQALQDAGVGRVADVEEIIRIVEQKREDGEGKPVC